MIDGICRGFLMMHNFLTLKGKVYGKYLFFTLGSEALDWSDIYWVGTGVIDDLKTIYINKE
jgi:hypothetical protein